MQKHRNPAEAARARSRVGDRGRAFVFVVVTVSMVVSGLYTGTAHAVLVDVFLDGTITSTGGLGTVLGDPGDPVSMTLSLETSTPDLDTDPTRYESGAAGSLMTDALFASAPVYEVLADATAGSWLAAGRGSLLIDIDFTIAVSGTGLVPDQVLPDFDQVAGAFAIFQGGANDIVAVAIHTVAFAPEPGTGLLVAFGLGLVAAKRRRRSSPRREPSRASEPAA